MSSLVSPRPQQSFQEETGEYEDMQRGPRLSFTPEFRTMYPQQSSTPSTVISVSREQVDSSTANMAMTPSCQGMLTDEQEKKRDLRNALFGDNYLIAKQQSKFDSQMRSTSTAMTARSGKIGSFGNDSYYCSRQRDIY